MSKRQYQGVMNPCLTISVRLPVTTTKRNNTREADYHSKHRNQNKARTFIRWANDTSDKVKLRTTQANDAQYMA